MGADGSAGCSLGAATQSGQLEGAVWAFPLGKANVLSAWGRAKFVESTAAVSSGWDGSGFGLTWDS